MLTVETFTYYLTLLVVTLILVWGLRLAGRALSSPATAANALTGDGPGESKMASALSEPASDEHAPPKGSFSRTAGIIGAIGLASVTVGFGYWVIYALFFKSADLKNIREVSWYFLSASALFFPYAFNQLSRLFKG